MIHDVKTKLGYKKLCTRWVPRMLTHEYKMFLDTSVTEDETRVYYCTSESKQQSQQWHLTDFLKIKKLKIPKNVFNSWGQEILSFWIDLIPEGKTVTAEAAMRH